MNNYKEIAERIGKLVEEKNVAYGDSFGKSGEVLKVLFPDGIPVEKYDDMLTMTRVIDKLFRIANEKEAFGENPWQDVAGYGILGASKKDSTEKSIS